MATSRRRERELARRRFERRRQAELERRAKTKKRNNVIGAVVGTVVLLGALTGGGFAIFGHKHHKSKTTGASATATPAITPSTGTTAVATPSTAESPTPATSASAPPPAPKKCAKISPNPPAKGEPRIPPVTGKAPTKLVSRDIKKGTGAAAKKGDMLTVQYVGLACSTGKPFDASYTDGAKNKEFSFQLGEGKVIPGWDNGLVGMKAGGYRELIIPAVDGYGTTGSPPTIAGNETLIFVVHMVKV